MKGNEKTKKKDVTLSDVRKALKVIKEYKDNPNTSDYNLAEEICKHLKEFSEEISRHEVMTNYAEEALESVKRTGYLPLIKNQNGVLEFIKLDSISSYSLYNRNDEDYISFCYEGGEYEYPLTRLDMQILHNIFEEKICLLEFQFNCAVKRNHKLCDKVYKYKS